MKKFTLPKLKFTLLERMLSRYKIQRDKILLIYINFDFLYFFKVIKEEETKFYIENIYLETRKLEDNNFFEEGILSHIKHNTYDGVYIILAEDFYTQEEIILPKLSKEELASVSFWEMEKLDGNLIYEPDYQEEENGFILYFYGIKKTFIDYLRDILKNEQLPLLYLSIDKLKNKPKNIKVNMAKGLLAVDEIENLMPILQNHLPQKNNFLKDDFDFYLYDWQKIYHKASIFAISFFCILCLFSFFHYKSVSDNLAVKLSKEEILKGDIKHYKEIEELNKRYKIEEKQILDLKTNSKDFYYLVTLLASYNIDGVRLDKISLEKNTFLIEGSAINYQLLEEYKENLADNVDFKEFNLISAQQNKDGKMVNFSLKGELK